jgi:hypothetical protein
MSDVVLVVLIVMYAVVAISFDRWHTLWMLGFKSETPMLFFENPGIYRITRIVLFALAVVASFFAKNIALHTGLGALAATWLSAFWLGRKLAFNRYREIHRELIAFDERMKTTDPAKYARDLYGKDPQVHRAELDAGARISEADLIARVNDFMRRGF